MSWWKRLWRSRVAPSSHGSIGAVRLALDGWSEKAPTGGMRIWRDARGDVLSLAAFDASFGLPDISDESALRLWCRLLAEKRHAGLVEVRVVEGALGMATSLIYKQLQKPAYIFTGMLVVPRQEGHQVWTVVARERGTTGMREAVVTTELIGAGKLTIEEYERSWAQDPYDPAYSGVDRSVLRFVSDDECFDERFPEHPLSKVRRVLAALPDAVQVESRVPVL